MTGAETVLKWFKEYHDMNKTAPTPYEIRCQLEMSIEQEKQSDCISNVVDSVNFGFCKHPNDVCKEQCQDCKAEEMWGNQNLH